MSLCIVGEFCLIARGKNVREKKIESVAPSCTSSALLIIPFFGLKSSARISSGKAKFLLFACPNMYPKFVRADCKRISDKPKILRKRSVRVEPAYHF